MTTETIGVRSQNESLRTQMRSERSSYDPHWRDIGDYVKPRRIRFSVSETNKGYKVNQKIINNTATLSSRTLRSGMVAGVSSPARPWFKLAVENKALSEVGSVKIWLEDVADILRSIFLKSNLYKVLPTIYGDLGNFSTGVIFQEEDFETVTRFYSFPIGSYYLANDDKLRVRVFMREFRMTVRQIVQKFGKTDVNGEPDWTNISEHVKSLWKNKQYEVWIDVTHTVKPNENFDPGQLESKYKRYISMYYETGTSKNNSSYLNPEEDTLLRERGYNHFPILAPRWETTGEDVYGNECPGMDSLGDIKALQTMEKRKAQAIEKEVNPAMTGSSALRNSKASILPGDFTAEDLAQGQKGFRPVHEVKMNIKDLAIDIQNTERRIKRAYYEDLFLMLSQTDRREITAREVDEVHEEKLLALGPVLEQVNDDLLDPLIENTYLFADAQGFIPPPPEELQGMEVKVEYISIMAQAQKLAGIASLERFVGFVLNLANSSGVVAVLDKIDLDQIIDVYADRVGVDAEIVVTDEDVAFIRQNRAAREQAQAAIDKIGKGAEVAETLSKADLEGDNALSRMLEQKQNANV